MAYSQPDTYWADRQTAQHDKITDRTIKDTEAALAKYYRIAAKSIIEEFEATYNHIQVRAAEGYVTPADLHALDRYVSMLQQVEQEAKKLGDNAVSLMREEFTSQWQEVYESTAVASEASFSTISTANAEVMVNKPWLADGKSFSERVYGNIAYLLDTLEEELVSCVITGKSKSDLKKKLQERFDISYRQAETLVRTETNHIQTEAARQAYEDAGVKKYMYLGREEHDIGCNCKKLDRKVFEMSEAKTGVNLPPLHPNCRCTIKAVIDDEQIKEINMKAEEKKMEERKALEQAWREDELLSEWMQEIEECIQEIEREHEKYRNARGWDDFFEKLDKIKAMPVWEQANWVDFCRWCGRAYMKESNKAHRQKYCPYCQAEKKWGRDVQKTYDAMVDRRLAKGMTLEEAERDAHEYWERKWDGETNQPYQKKGRKRKSKIRKAPDTIAAIITFCNNCGKKMDGRYKGSDLCEECWHKEHPYGEKSSGFLKDRGDYCIHCGKELSRRDKESKNHPHMKICAQCQKKIFNSEWGLQHKAKGFTEYELLLYYRNTEDSSQFTLSNPTYSLKDSYIQQEKKYKNTSGTAIAKKIKNLDESDFYKCVDCEKIFIKESRKATRQLRCPKCQEKHDKERKRKAAQEARGKAKAEKIAQELEEAKAKAKEEAEEARRKYKAEWARNNRAKKKLMKL